MDGRQRVGALTQRSETSGARTGPDDALVSIRIQKIREDESNLYFNASSWWRWCEFSAHPRVMVYADRTGAELTDIRVRGDSGQL